MNRYRLPVLATCAAVFGLLGGAAWALEPMMRADVPFEFTVQVGTLSAGSYEVLADHTDDSRVVLRNTATGRATQLSVVTRLADLGGSEPMLIFDKVGDARFLSEIHVPNMDGFALQGAPDRHKHEKVPATK